MAKMKTEVIKDSARFKKIADDISVIYTAGAGILKKGQVIAFNKTTGKAGIYTKGDSALGNVFGLHTGEDITLTSGDHTILVSTLIFSTKEDIVGIASGDFPKMLGELKAGGVFIVGKAVGTEGAL